jgi:hypothetical protein
MIYFCDRVEHPSFITTLIFWITRININVQDMIYMMVWFGWLLVWLVSHWVRWLGKNICRRMLSSDYFPLIDRLSIHDLDIIKWLFPANKPFIDTWFRHYQSPQFLHTTNLHITDYKFLLCCKWWYTYFQKPNDGNGPRFGNSWVTGPRGHPVTSHYCHIQETRRFFDTWGFEEMETTSNLQIIRQNKTGNVRII